MCGSIRCRARIAQWRHASPAACLLALVLTGLPVTPVAAEGALAGHYRLGGATLYDPPQGEPADTHMYFELNGDAARALYDALKLAAQPDPCGDGGSVKTHDGLQCVRDAGGQEHRCWFGIDLRRPRIVNGVVC